MELDANRTDRVAALTRSLAGLVPGFGAMIGEVLAALIPNQRIDRLADYFRSLHDKVGALAGDISVIRERLEEPERLEIFEDGMVQAARSPSVERRERIASVVARGLSEDEFEYERVKKILNTLRDLTDSEIIVLKGYELHGDAYRELAQKHRWVLRPASRVVGSQGSPEEHERGALQDAWRRTLERLGLLSTAPRGDQLELTRFGRMVLRYLFTDDVGAETDTNRVSGR